VRLGQKGAIRWEGLRPGFWRARKGANAGYGEKRKADELFPPRYLPGTRLPHGQGADCPARGWRRPSVGQAIERPHRRMASCRAGTPPGNGVPSDFFFQQRPGARGTPDAIVVRPVKVRSTGSPRFSAERFLGRFAEHKPETPKLQVRAPEKGQTIRTFSGRAEWPPGGRQAGASRAKRRGGRRSTRAAWKRGDQNGSESKIR